ncbi:MAG TPA: preprotein translocase subunit YajC [Gemmatimonadales bacterium]|jgi:preprotein translocase subunit YajC|nr:preprotein translocase subunit YajC [Gemmatimonadales bacterium]
MSQTVMIALQLLALFAVIYWFMIRPQAQARKTTAAMQDGIKKGDDVMTAGGIMGKVRDVKVDRLTIETGTAQIVVDRSRIVRVGTVNAPETDS